MKTEVIATAKKLKKLWVEKQKIKSKWKAQKRKEGIVTRRDDITTTSTSQPEEAGADNESEDDENVEDPHTNSTPVPESEPELTPAPPPKRKKLSKGADEVEEEPEKPSLRELQRQAYSPASLHHYKSDPLHRHRGRGGGSFGNRGGRGGGSDRGRGSRGGRGSNGRGQSRGRGRGQPDMRLRMSAMLEKIKHDMS